MRLPSQAASVPLSLVDYLLKRPTTQINTPGGLSWYVTESKKVSNPTLTLIPSGEGDLHPTQIVGLMDALKIPATAFWGSSSGGLCSLALLQYFSDRVRNIIIREVPFEGLMNIYALKEQDDETIVQSCKGLFGQVMNEDQAAWNALGDEHHWRLEKNYVIWVRGYVGVLETGDWEDLVKANAR